MTVSSDECLRSLIGAAADEDDEGDDVDVDVDVGSLSDPDMEEYEVDEYDGGPAFAVPPSAALPPPTPPATLTFVTTVTAEDDDDLVWWWLFLPEEDADDEACFVILSMADRMSSMSADVVSSSVGDERTWLWSSCSKINVEKTINIRRQKIYQH